MRRKSRIPIFLNVVDWTQLLKIPKIFKYDDDIDKIVYEIEKNIGRIGNYWNKYPDLRIFQVLINLGFIPNVPGEYYALEENTILKILQVPPEKYLTWTSVMDESGFFLPEPVTNLIVDLKTSHIENIINGHLRSYIVQEDCMDLMKRVLKERGAD